MIPRTLISAVLLMVLLPASACADLQIAADVNRKSVGVGQELVLSVTVTGGFQNLPTPELPPIDGFSVYPSGSSTSFSLVNGQVTSSKTSRFVLVPQRAGTLTIPAISILHKGSQYTTRPMEITVTASAQLAPSAPSGEPSAPGNGLMLRASLDKKQAYVSEQVTLTLRFYRRISVVSSRLVPPVTKGFWVEELPGEKNYHAVEEGLQYAVTEIAMALFPTTDGVLKIGPATWECAVRARSDPFNMAPFDFWGRARARSVSISSEELELKVLPLPQEGRPAEFHGAVGRFSVRALADREQVPVEEPLTVTVTVTGRGNINAVGDVTIPEIAGFRSYDSGGSVDVSKDDGVVQGSKSFSRVLIPSVPGEYVIPSVTFAYFDPAKGRYALASSKEIPVTVVAAEGTPAVVSAGPDRGGLVAKDIRYIKTQMPSFSRAGDRLHRRTSFVMLQVLPALMVAFAYAYRAARERAGADPARARSRRAKGQAMKRLARTAPARSADAGGGWKDLAETLRNYVADILDTSGRGLTMDEVRAGLLQEGVDESLIRETAELLDRCDAAAYAPASSSSPEIGDAVSAVKDLIKKLERARRNR